MPNVHTGLYVVMGVSGCGKTRVGATFAKEMGIPFIEGDDYHAPESVRKMSSGIPLTDEDRGGWLQTLAALIRDAGNAGTGLVLACSSLKRSYREILRDAARLPPDVVVTGNIDHLVVSDRGALAKRLASEDFTPEDYDELSKALT